MRLADIPYFLGYPAAVALNWFVGCVFGLDVCKAERDNAYVEYIAKVRENMRKEL
jgi:hypothetical protein